MVIHDRPAWKPSSTSFSNRRAVVVLGHAPFLVVIGEIERVGPRPRAAQRAVGVGDGDDDARRLVSLGHGSSRHFFHRAGSFRAWRARGQGQNGAPSSAARIGAATGACKRRAVVRRPVDRGPDLDEFERRLGRGPQQPQGRRGGDAVGVEPGREIGGLEDRRHPVADPADEGVGGRGDDAGGVDLAPARIAPGLVEAGECGRSAADPAHQIRPPGRARARVPSPRVVAVGEDEAAAAHQRGAIARLLRDRLGPCVDEQRKRLRVLDEAGQEAPADEQEAAVGAAAVGPREHDRDRLGRRDVGARREVRRLRVAEIGACGLGRQGEGVASAHGSSPVAARRRRRLDGARLTLLKGLVRVGRRDCIPWLQCRLILKPR